MDEKTIQRIKKLQALAERGVGGEKTTAQKKLAKLLKDNGINSLDELQKEEYEYTIFSYNGKHEIKLLRQCMYKVMGAKSDRTAYKPYGRRQKIGIYCTKAQKIEIELEFEFYRNVFYEELSTFMDAFIQAQQIFPEDAPTGDYDEFNERDMKIAFMARLLVDDVTKTDARALLNVNKMATISDIVAPSNEYIYASGANELTVVEGCVIAVGGAGIFKTANTILTAANLDAGSAFAVGKDYYVYICDSRIDSADEKYVISLNSTYPTGWNATNSRKIGGFHYGRCRKVDSNLQPLNGSSVIFGTGWESAVSNGIVPRSVWTLGHRPKCSPEGMVYLGGGTWVDIYLNSDDGAKGLKSEYGCAPMTGTESMNWYNFVERLAKSGKRLPNYAEFCAYAFGSPAGLDNANTNAWSATSNTGRGVTGSVVNAVSSVGVVDAVGRVWEWLDELITRAEHATNADYHASVAWGWDKKSPLNTGEKSYDVGNIYQYYAYSLAALVAGGDWDDGASCGARAVYCSDCPWDVKGYTT